MTQTSNSTAAVAVAPHESFFLDAIRAHEKFTSSIKQAKIHAFDAGLFLLSAKQTTPHGEWLTYLESRENAIPKRTAQHYMKFASECLEFAGKQFPDIGEQDKLVLKARGMVIDSALTFMELCREVGVIRPRPAEGARDGKEASLARRGQQQWNWQTFCLPLEVFEGLEDNPFLDAPEGELPKAKQRAQRMLDMIGAAELSQLQKRINKWDAESAVNEPSTAGQLAETIESALP